MKYLFLLLLLAGCVKPVEPKRTHLQLNANGSSYKELYITYTDADLKVVSFKATPKNANTQFMYESDFLPGHISISCNASDNSKVSVAIANGKMPPDMISSIANGNGEQTASYDLH